MLGSFRLNSTRSERPFQFAMAGIINESLLDIEA